MFSTGQKETSSTTPHPESVISALEEGASCAICLLNFEDVRSKGEDHSAVKLECGHIFGSSCIKIWLADFADRGKNGRCSTFRANLQNLVRKRLWKSVTRLRAPSGKPGTMR